MNLTIFATLTFTLIFLSCSTTRSNKNETIAEKRPGVKCMENSPERQGEEGCTILANRSLAGPLSNNMYWHLDRFNSLEEAKEAAGPNSVAAEAHGYFWLMTLETKTEKHGAGNHVTWIGPLELPSTDSYAFRVQSSLLLPGSRTPAHTHPGPEAVYVVDGVQCMQTPENGILLNAGQSYIVPNGIIHQGVVMGSKPRRALGINLYDANHPTSHDIERPPALRSCNENN